MIIECFKVGWLSTNCYVAGCEETKEAAIIDPGLETENEAEEILEFIKQNGFHVKYVINTHGHPDHIS
ncbi:MBL fold metallo-hydrolase, partial [Candidatus Bathyarchaeota archaeon]|nr:MBL fold metallo-hydrolase [Candidatus Bathyarchaeota archaeon]